MVSQNKISRKISEKKREEKFLKGTQAQKDIFRGDIRVSNKVFISCAFLKAKDISNVLIGKYMEIYTQNKFYIMKSTSYSH